MFNFLCMKLFSLFLTKHQGQGYWGKVEVDGDGAESEVGYSGSPSCSRDSRYYMDDDASTNGPRQERVTSYHPRQINSGGSGAFHHGHSFSCRGRFMILSTLLICSGGKQSRIDLCFCLELRNFNMVKVYIHDNRSYIGMSVHTDILFEGTLAFSVGLMWINTCVAAFYCYAIKNPQTRISWMGRLKVAGNKAEGLAKTSKKHADTTKVKHDSYYFHPAYILFLSTCAKPPVFWLGRPTWFMKAQVYATSSFVIQETNHPHGKLRDQRDWSMQDSWKVCKKSSDGGRQMYIDLFISR